MSLSVKRTVTLATRVVFIVTTSDTTITSDLSDAADVMRSAADLLRSQTDADDSPWLAFERERACEDLRNRLRLIEVAGDRFGIVGRVRELLPGGDNE